MDCLMKILSKCELLLYGWIWYCYALVDVGQGDICFRFELATIMLVLEPKGMQSLIEDITKRCKEAYLVAIGHIS